jgi:outer membrane protein assembly factor BamB
LAREDGRLLWRVSCPGEDVLDDAQRKAWTASAPDRAEKARLEQELRKCKDQLRKTPDDAALKTRQDELAAQIKSVNEKLRGVPVVPQIGGHKQTGGATATPAVDVAGKRVFVFIASGVVAAHDFEGKRLWIRALPLGGASWGHCSSPLLTAGKLIVAHGAVSALDPATGNVLWTTPAQARHGSPLAVEVAGKSCVLTANGLLLNATDGSVLAKDLPSLPYNTAVVKDGVLYAVGVGDTKAVAYRLPSAAGETALKLWETEVAKGRYYGSPVLSNGLLFGIRQSGTLVALDAATGEKKGEVVLESLSRNGGQCYPSLAVAGSVLFASSDNGTTVLLEPAAALKVTGENRLERGRATPVFSADRIYVRSMEHLYCIGAK